MRINDPYIDPTLSEKVRQAFADGDFTDTMLTFEQLLAAPAVAMWSPRDESIEELVSFYEDLAEAAGQWRYTS